MEKLRGYDTLSRGGPSGIRAHNDPGAESLGVRRKVPTISQVLSSIEHTTFTPENKRHDRVATNRRAPSGA